MMRYLWTLLLPLCSLALGQGSFYRAADGTWRPLKATAAAQVTKFSLSPEDIGGGATLVVINKPKWMVLDDREAPGIVKVLLDGQEREADDLDLGAVATAPGELAFAIQDAKNPLDVAARVTLNGAPVPAARVTTTKLTPDGKSLRIAIKPGTLPQAKYALIATVTDLAPERNATTVALKFSTAPLIANGSFEEVDAQGKAIGWSPGSWGGNAPGTYEAGVAEGGVEGQRAFRFNGLGDGLNLVCSQDLGQLKPGTYVLTGQYKSEAGCGVSAITSDAAGTEVDYLTHSLAASAEWTPFTWGFELKPHTQALIVPRTGGKGETWFDALRLNAK